MDDYLESYRDVDLAKNKQLLTSQNCYQKEDLD